MRRCSCDCESICIVLVSSLPVFCLPPPALSLARVFRLRLLPLPYRARFSLVYSPPFTLPNALAVLFDRPLMFYWAAPLLANSLFFFLRSLPETAVSVISEFKCRRVAPNTSQPRRLLMVNFYGNRGKDRRGRERKINATKNIARERLCKK